MKYLIFCLVLVGLTSCSSVISYEDKGSVPSVPSDQIESIVKTASGLIPTQDGFTSSGLPMDIYAQIGEINIKKGEDGQYRESTLGYLVHNPESCTYGINGIYHWIDWGNDSNIFEAGCFKSSDLRQAVQSSLGYFEDENGTYYSDKDGGAYNLRRISKYFSGELIDSLVTTNGSGWIQDRVKLYSLGSGPYIVDQVFMNGRLLSGVTDPYALKIMRIGSDESAITAVTDGKAVWSYKSEFVGADASTLKYLKDGIYVDKNSCYIQQIPFEIKKLNNCDPKTISRLTEDPGNWMDTKMYSDGKNAYNAYGDIIESK